MSLVQVAERSRAGVWVCWSAPLVKIDQNTNFAKLPKTSKWLFLYNLEVIYKLLMF